MLLFFPKKVIPFLILLCIGNSVLGEFQIINVNYSYTVKNIDSYNSIIEIEGINLSNYAQSFSYPINESSELTSIEVYEHNGKKWKSSSIKNSYYESTISWGSFFTGTKYAEFSIPPKKHFKFIFSLSEEYTIFLTTMNPHGNLSSINTTYNFKLPFDLTLSTSKGNTYKNNCSFTTEDIDSLDCITYLIHPSESSPEEHFSNWFEAKTLPQLSLSELAVPEELKAIALDSNRYTLAASCFNFVQRKIKYIDVENGIGAIIPRQCEKTLKNGLGDCKDMATLLTALYSYFGFNVYLGISRTNSKDANFNFPSIGLANHMICALQLDNEWYYLDPTEDACIFGDPSLQILGTETFLIGKKDNPFKLVPAQPRSISDGSIFYQIDSQKEQIILKIEAQGKMNHLFYHTYIKYHDSDKLVASILSRFSDLNWNIDSSSVTQKKSNFYTSTSLNQTFFSEIQNQIVYNSSLLFPLESILLIFQNNDYPLYDTNVKIGLKFDHEVNRAFGTSQEINKTIKKNEVILDFHLSKTINLELFEKSELYVNWESFFAKPISVSNEN